MTHPLEDCYLKLDRADEHLEAIKTEIQGFLDREPYYVVGQLYPGSPGKLHYLATGKVRAQPPKKLRVLIGDFLHNLRSSLDTLADTLATDPVTGEVPKGTEFPIFENRGLFFKTSRKGVPDRGSGLHKIRGMDRGPETMIKWLQPYRRINDPQGHPLWRLQTLNIGDKHRRPHLTGTVMEGSRFGIKSMQDVDLHLHGWGMSATSGPFKDGATVGSMTLTITGPNPQMDVDTDFTFNVAFDPKGVARGRPVVAGLTELRDFVRSGVFPKLEPFV
jgi:hypothetical protein